MRINRSTGIVIIAGKQEVSEKNVTLSAVIIKNMRKRLIILFLLLVSIANLKASPQASDYLIIGNDTLPLYQLILEDYLHSVEQPTDSNSLFAADFHLWGFNSLD